MLIICIYSKIQQISQCLQAYFMLSSNITANKFAQIIFSFVLIRNKNAKRPLHLRAVEGGRGSWVPLIGKASLATSLQVGRNKFTALERCKA